MPAEYNTRGKCSSEDVSAPLSADAASTTDVLLPEPSTTQQAKQVRTGPATDKVSHKKELNTERIASFGILHLPIDILAEIAPFIQPGDLLALARCCKGLRETLMDSSTAHVWHSAESNVDELPRRPEDMSGPQYAALLFTKLCTSCGKSTSARANPFLRVRLCSNCRKIRLVNFEDSWKVGNYRSHLVPLTKRVRFKFSNAELHTYNVRSDIECCLVEEMGEVDSQHARYMTTNDLSSYETWRTNRRLYVEKRRQFGGLLGRYIGSVERPRLVERDDLSIERRGTIYKRLRGLGWSDADFQFPASPVGDQWHALLDRPKVVSDQNWEKLLAQLVSLLEAKHCENSERAKEERKRERRKRVYTLLQQLKPQINPFARLLKELGFDPCQAPDASEDWLAIPKELVNYPFPNYATVLEAPCLDDVNNLELSVEEVEALFYERQDRIEEAITEWRRQGEQQLVDFWQSENENPPSDIANNTTEIQTSHTNFLLRADTIFSWYTPGEVTGHRWTHHYPGFVREGGDHLDTNGHHPHQCPSKMAWRRYYRHVEAEKIAKAILGRHEMPDATYYELKVLGSTFVCARCEDKKPKTWDDMIGHYIEAGTADLVHIRDTHDVEATLKPFVRLLEDKEEEEPAILPTLGLRTSLGCLLWKN
ncbi:hypothetical protein BDV93DRAFT_194019 [Ceratobasidium sp. AG-I]|nr:hypothetical protein BDV93DRAFT_194019 [Ceratobasidium sp. AG-I]